MNRRCPTRRSLPFGLVLALLPLLFGCATSSPILAARVAYDTGRADEALALLEQGEIADRDRLVMLMEAGTIAQAAGQIEASIRHLAAAAELADRLEAIDVSEQGSALVVNDRVRRYAGEYAERLWIRTVQMVNYLVLGDLSGAAVEARQAIALYERFGEPVDGDVFSRTLAARVLDTVGESGSAAIEYARAFEASNGSVAIARMAIDAAQRNGREDDVARFRDALERSASTATSAMGGRLWLIAADGQVPVKRAGNLFLRPDLRISFPYYAQYELNPAGESVRVLVDDVPLGEPLVSTSLGPVVAASLAARASQITARQALRVVAKQGISHAARSEDELLGALVDAVLFLLEEADTRGWRTLPGRWSMLDLPLTPGSHSLRIENGGDALEIPALLIGRGAPTVVLVQDGPNGLRRVLPVAPADPDDDAGARTDVEPLALAHD